MIRIAMSLVVLSFTASTAVAEAKTRTPNAALLYWQAIALLPEFTEAEQTAINQSARGDDVGAELDDASRRLIERSRVALTMMQRGAKITNCDWGATWEDGAETQLPYLGKARRLVQLAVLRARHHLQQDDLNGELAAVEDLVAATRLAHHAGSDDMIITQLVRNSLEALVIEVISHHLIELRPEAQRSLLVGLESLPEPRRLDAAILGEKRVMVDWLKLKFGGENAKQGNAAFSILLDPTQQKELRKQAPNAAVMTKLLDDLAARYDEAAKIPLLAPDEWQPRWETLLEKVMATNPLASTLLPAVDRACIADARSHLRRLMQKAALYHVLGDQAKFQKTQDPYSDDTFVLEKTRSGFKLVSNLNIEGEKFAMEFGN